MSSAPTDEEDKRSPKDPSAARALYQKQAEIRGKVAVRKGGFGEKDKGVEDKASQVGGETLWTAVCHSIVWAGVVLLVSVSAPGFDP